MSNNSETHYKELSLFNDIKNPGHRAWNRLITVTNLKEDGREEDAKGYIDKLSSVDQAAMALVAMKANKLGLDTVKAELNRSITTETEEKIGV